MSDLRKYADPCAEQGDVVRRVACLEETVERLRGMLRECLPAVGYRPRPGFRVGPPMKFDKEWRHNGQHAICPRCDLARRIRKEVGDET